MTPRRLALAMLAVAGVLVAHSIGDALAAALGGQGVPGHGHIFPALAIAAPIAAVLAAAAAVGEARRADLMFQLSCPRLLATQVVLFAALEVGERLVLGHLGSMTIEPGVLFGLVAQVPVAMVVCRLVRFVRRIAVRMLASSPPRLPRSVRHSPPKPAADPSRRLWTPVSSRAPPISA